jgi:short-subunit dehydrogenase
VRVRGSVALVTGASSGIGWETALLLARKGAQVRAVARSGDDLDRLAGEHVNITPHVADLAVAEQRASLAEAAGDVDILVNNAGLGWTGLVEDMPADRIRLLFEVNVLALVDLTQLVLPGMLARKRGRLVNVASVVSWVAAPPFTVYSATKFAVQGFSEGLQREVAGRGVAVSTVNPGPIASKFWARSTGEDRHSQEFGDDLKPGLPPSLVARAVVRAVRLGSLPGYGTIAVPRMMGLVRLGAVPVLRLGVHAGSRLSRQPALWRRVQGD